LPIDSKTDDHYEVWPDCWPAVDLFIKAQTQWRTSAAGLIGLDYGAVRWLMEIYAISDACRVLEDLQVIEARVLEAMNDRKD